MELEGDPEGESKDLKAVSGGEEDVKIGPYAGDADGRGVCRV